jgi:NTP pyrophosphatase (non-canonical NTP hydrolase)
MNKIPINERDKVYINAFITYGEDCQIIKAVEELSECIQAICKVCLGGEDFSNLAEEIADATIMLEQLRLIFNNDEEVCRYMDEKVQRLDDKLRGGAYDE